MKGSLHRQPYKYARIKLPASAAATKLPEKHL